MNAEPPRYELCSVYSDGTVIPAQIVQVNDISWADTAMSRRRFMGVSLTAVAATALCASGPALAAGTKRRPAADNCAGAKAHRDRVGSLVVSPDGKLLVSKSGTSIKLWSLPDGALLKTLSLDESVYGTSMVAISSDGELLVGQTSSSIKLWSLPDGALLKTLHHGHINSIAISPDWKLLASTSGDQTIKLWSLPDGALLKTLRQEGGVKLVAISPDGKLLVSGSSSGKKTIKLWSLPNGALLKTLEDHKSSVYSLAISPGGELLVSGSFVDNIIELRSLPDGTLLKTLESHKDKVYSVAISPDGKLLVSGSDSFGSSDSSIQLWSLPDGALLKTLESNKGSFTISSDGTLLVSGADSSIKLWSLPNGTLLKTLKGHKGTVYEVAISPDGKLFVSGDSGGTIRLWSFPKGEYKTCLLDLEDSPPSVKGITVEGRDAYGQIFTYTLPCGSPIPTGSTCTCNCVPGSYSPQPSSSSIPCGRPIPPGAVCTCNCVPVSR